MSIVYIYRRILPAYIRWIYYYSQYKQASKLLVPLITGSLDCTAIFVETMAFLEGNELTFATYHQKQ